MLNSITLDIGTIDYEESGPRDGRSVVFVHGYLMGAGLWGPLTASLARSGLRCVAPTWPLGGHARPMADRAAVSVPGIASAVADALTALDLEDVVLVGNDTGGLISQIVAGSHADRVGALVLTSCDAFEHFPPPILKPFILAARSSPTFRAAMQPMRARFARQRAFGELSHCEIDELVAAWVAPALADRGIAEDLRQLTASLERQTSLDAAAGLKAFDKPALVAWSADDVFFPVEDGRRLAATLPNARLEIVEHARTFSMLDQPDRLSDLIIDFVNTSATAGAVHRSQQVN